MDTINHLHLNMIAGLRIALASPEQIRSWSCGEVTRPDTINYLTTLPEKGGLFCERIFGPLKDWTCACGTRRTADDSGIICETCGVEIAPSRVRRERMGHIGLAVPVAHSWFARGTSSILATLLGLPQRQLVSLLSYTGYLVEEIDENERRRYLDDGCKQEEQPECIKRLASLTVGTVLDAVHDQDCIARYGNCFRMQTGGQAVRDWLHRLDLATLAISLRRTMSQGKGNQQHAIKRLRIVEAFRQSGIHPAWMIINVLPVLPPDLRPLVHLGGGRFAASDLNRLYERVIHRNMRVRRFMQQEAPDAILHYEMQLLQDACDALFDNARCIRPLLGADKQPLKSLSDSLKGKQGRFRRNLLGKRVDYSGRSVICVGLDLHLHECGLPKKIALELFKPFVINKLLDRDKAKTPRAARRLIERRHPCIWDLLAECMHEKVVLLNRAPTLHRLSIQAFKPKLVEGDAIRLHPLVCSAFNADFDGDQMAVHLPLSHEAQAEARRLMLSIRNLRSPASGEPTISLSQEIVLGCFYLTEQRQSTPHARHVFADANEAQIAYHHQVIDLHAPITVRVPHEHIYSTPPPTPTSTPHRGRITTTVGRLLFNELLPTCFGYRNYAMTKESLKQLLVESLTRTSEEETAKLADAIKQLGYQYATRSGISFAMSDMQEPEEKQRLVAQGQIAAQELQHDYHDGMMNEDERDQRIIALWTEITEQISEKLLALLDPYGTISTIIKSGATKAKFQQIRQLSGIRGLMADPSGRIIPIPVLSNYLTGLKTWEVFIAASGARKGFMDRSLNTAQSGYLTRKLVEVGMEVWTTQEDCGTYEGWRITNEESQAQGLPDLTSRVVGRVLAVSVGSLEAGTLLTEEHMKQLLASGRTSLYVRSPFTCQANYGICCCCYGADLSTGKLVKCGVAVGIIAGQSIGEPGTQLTMRTFHAGGIANAQGDITQGLPRVIELFEARTPRHAALLAEVEGIIQINRQAEKATTEIAIVQQNRAMQSPEKLVTYQLPSNQSLLVQDGQQVTRGTPLTTGACDPKHLLMLRGQTFTAHYLINEVQRVYRGTGVYINDKHLEAIVRQMLRSVQVADPGETDLLPGDMLDRFDFIRANRKTLIQDGKPALAHPILLGLTKAALHTASWIAAASFQETSRVLTDAAMKGQVDVLRGFKERVVVGIRVPNQA